MGGKRKPDVSGWATRYNVTCSDGLTLAPGAFARNDGDKVTVVFQHNHQSISNVLGHALVKDMPEGVRADIFFDDTPEGRSARTRVENGTLNSLSVFATGVEKNGTVVTHADLAEISLVLKGANPEAKIDEVFIQHSYGDLEDAEAFVAVFGDALSHADDGGSDSSDGGDSEEDDEETVEDIWNDFSDIQKEAVAVIVEAALKKAGEDDSDDNDNDKKEEDVAHNVFEGGTATLRSDVDIDAARAAIGHDITALGSFRAAYLAHAETYGLKSPEVLFPEAQATGEIKVIDRDQTWVTQLLGGIRKLPYSRFKPRYADLTPDELRARGYITGSRKLDIVTEINQRETSPHTVYVKTRLDRDTEIDLSAVQNFQVWNYLWSLLRRKMNEELARAMLLGDGRSAGSPDKILENRIRPIVSDDDWYTRRFKMSDASLKLEDSSAVEEVSLIMDAYMGEGMPYFYGASQTIARLLHAKDKQGRALYSSKAELADKMGLAGFVTVPYLRNAKTVTEAGARDIFGVIVNPSDYWSGTDNGGQLTQFEAFDIDVNQKKALLETRLSGALSAPGTAILLTGTPTPLTGVMVPDPKKAADPQLPILK
jgi:caudovirus prohead protease|uniref:Major capsid protein n=1 Tax=Siphoviridae sp. ctYsl40 TaxID=2827890 RepID=A0A8S5TD92_9CAUD|nr:MAG TPA: major capsid protein [Siphoviridae sp. ctYsl40]